ncbi:histidine--tRNA ligase [Kordiimonas marina]|uniref:histidine--tRNA ligase n=1 Tax=Kordiimonas marina TaxID=2872312 RepID=UPI001FF5C23D|nr:histidine--tRNA ligase [Kordiimonas marina]
MSKLQPARGTRDIFGDEARSMTAVVETFRKVATTYGFEEMATPIFEFTEVFKRPLGEASDVVSKEMYTFEDRGGEEITLRPEFTAGVCRAFISNGLQQHLPCRLMSWGPVFRYERPQKGRYRQFHQINAELLGPETPEFDVDMIALAWSLLKALGLGDKVVLNLNTLGDIESRMAYRDALVSYFEGFKDKLSEDSVRRLTTNPLRILDSKDEGDKLLVANAPLLSEHLNDHSRQFFETVCKGLDAVGVPYEHNERLVRGLDYYTHTAFEFITTELGAQGTVLAGGRYDGLIEKLGGPKVAGIGWAGGIERLAMLSNIVTDAERSIVLVPMGEAGTLKAFTVADDLRTAGHVVTADRSGNLGKRLTRAAKANARYAIIIGDDDVAAGTAMLKDLDSGEQSSVAFDALVAAVKA